MPSHHHHHLLHGGVDHQTHALDDRAQGTLMLYDRPPDKLCKDYLTAFFKYSQKNAQHSSIFRYIHILNRQFTVKNGTILDVKEDKLPVNVLRQIGEEETKL